MKGEEPVGLVSVSVDLGQSVSSPLPASREASSQSVCALEAPSPRPSPPLPPRPTTQPTHPTARTPTPHGHPLRSDVCVFAYVPPKTSMLFHNTVPI